jgi:serine/threonine protein kinase
MTDRVGQQLGNYRLVRLLGEGGFAQVYLGEHIHLGTQAALKLLHTQLSQEDVEQFRTEARIIAHLEHPSIIRVLDFGIVEKTPYLIMSYAPNGTLRQRYPRGTRLSLTTVLTYVTQVAQALQYAHSQKIIHRDIKPENILLGRSRETLLSDFGIALVSQTSRSQVSANVVGTVAYMAPEQIQGKPGPASDQYALAVVVYEWITGERPFQGSFTEIAVQHAVTPPPSLRTRIPELSPDVENVVLTALHKEPQQRFLNVQAFAIALEQAIAEMNQEMMPTLSSTHTPAPAPSYTYVPTLATPHAQERTPLSPALETPRHVASTSEVFPITTKPAKQRISRRTVIFLAGAVAASAALGAGLTWFFLSQQRGSQTSINGTTPVPSTSASTPAPTSTATARSTPRSGATSPSTHSIGTTLNVYRGHTLYVYGVTWASSDGQRIASASDDQTVQDWGTYTNQRYFLYQQNGPINDVKASHNRTRLASAGDDHTVQIRDARTGTLISTYVGHTGAVYTAEWSPDDRHIVTSSADNTVRVWEVASGNTITIYRQHTNIVWTAGWSPDGTSIVSGSADNTARVWDATSGATLQIYTGHSATVRSVSWSEQHYGIATASEDLTVQVWNPHSGATLTTYRGHTALLRTVAWSHSSSHIVSGAHDATAQIWDGLSGQHIFTYRGHSSTVFDAQWSADDMLIVSGSTDATAQIWQAS